MSPWAAEPRQAPPPRPGDGPQEPELRRARGASGQGPAQPGGHGETQPRAPTAADGPTEARGMSRSEWVLPAPPRAHGGRGGQWLGTLGRPRRLRWGTAPAGRTAAAWAHTAGTRPAWRPERACACGWDRTRPDPA